MVPVLTLLSVLALALLSCRETGTTDRVGADADVARARIAGSETVGLPPSPEVERAEQELAAAQKSRDHQERAVARGPTLAEKVADAGGLEAYAAGWCKRGPEQKGVTPPAALPPPPARTVICSVKRDPEKKETLEVSYITLLAEPALLQHYQATLLQKGYTVTPLARDEGGPGLRYADPALGGGNLFSMVGGGRYGYYSLSFTPPVRR